jgi:hypothetical protein
MNDAATIEAPAKATLVPIQPAELRDRVRFVMPHLDPAIERGGDAFASDIFLEVASGNMQLWEIEQDGRTVGACITKVAVRPRRKVVTVVYLGSVGSAHMPEWLPLLGEIEGWAKAIGAHCVQVVGRKGWKRVLEGYRADSVVLTKDLAADV